MKKIFLSLLVAAGMLTSCDMDLKPVGSLDDQEAIQSPFDASRFRAGLYSSFRALTTSGFFTYPEIQMDMFQGTTINGNRGGSLANGTIVSSDSDITGYWASMYAVINSANYLISNIEPLLEVAIQNEDQEAVVAYERYLAESRFVRAWCYGEMFDRWCQVYSEEKGEQDGLGLPIVTEYKPTDDRSQYPGRASMNATIKFINDELDDVLLAFEKYEATEGAEQPAPMASYFNSNVVKAFQARFALWTGDYDTAVSKANDVISSGDYALATTRNYYNMWASDTGNEIIYMSYMAAPDELSNSIGSRWLSIYDNKADYIPSYDAFMMYDEDDVRYESFFGVRRLVVEGQRIAVYAFYKFPGNTALRTIGSANNLMNKPKSFRLSEMYLILAEASAINGDENTANSALNDIRKNRIDGYREATYSGDILINEIRTERTKELIGEGFRMSDLRRWNEGFKRDYAHPENPAIEGILVPAGALVEYVPGDYRYTWPIPSDELSTTPQIQGPQNPGY